MKRSHSMPFGPRITPSGSIMFRLWAPSASKVDLHLDDHPPVTMMPTGGGWHECLSAHAAPGSQYCFQIDDGLCVPDPASRYNPNDVHAASVLVDPESFDWQDIDWRGRPWEEAVIYELHVGTFTPEGTFAAAEEKLDYLVRLGVTAIELMPLADFPGQRNWGYDGVLLFAPDSSYGTPDDLKRFIQAAHLRGLMVYLDVVYNHFGPEGNYLHVYAKQFFTERHHTPWGAAINFDGEANRIVRDFYVHNALFWLSEYHFDGLRFDAVHAIMDDSETDILEEIATTVRKELGPNRHIHLMLECVHMTPRHLGRKPDGKVVHYNAQWNDETHHALHVLLTGESDGYYAPFADDPICHLGHHLTATLANVCAPSGAEHLPLTCFVNFLQNHDQVGNRAMGERLSMLAPPEALAAATALLLLAPTPPLLFMGEEWATQRPFLYFCDLGENLRESITEGRRQEFAAFEQFSDPATLASIPDPCEEDTFSRAKLDWDEANISTHQDWLALYRNLLALRQKKLVPHLRGACGTGYDALSTHALTAHWILGNSSLLTVHANLGRDAVKLASRPTGTLLYATTQNVTTLTDSGVLPGYTTAWFLEDDND